MLTYISDGIIAGILASFIMGFKTTLLQNALLGVVGSVIGERIFHIFGFYSFGFLSKIITSFVGACIFIFLVTIIFARNKK